MSAGCTSKIVNVLNTVADKTESLQMRFGKSGGLADRALYGIIRGLTNVSLRLQGVDGSIGKVSNDTEKLSGKTNRLLKFMSGLGNSFKSLGRSKAFNFLGNQATRFALILFSVRKILSYMREAMNRLPDSIKGPFTSVLQNIKDLLGGGLGALLQGMAAGLNRLNAAFKSAAGQKFARGLEAALRQLGTIIGFFLEKGARFIELLGNNMPMVITICTVVLGVWTAAWIASAVAEMAAMWPLLLIIGAVIGIIAILYKLGFTSSQIFGGIGAMAGAVYALVRNHIAAVFNAVVALAEFIANAFDNPLNAAKNLFFDFADSVLATLETVAKAIDRIFGSNLADVVNNWRSGMDKFRKSVTTENKIKFSRMDYVDYDATVDKFSAAGSAFGNLLTDSALENAVAVPLKNIEKNTKKSEQTNEQIKSLVDLTTRKYVNKINLTAQTPIVNINGANTGSSVADRKAIADAVRDVLVEQISSSADRSNAIAW